MFSLLCSILFSEYTIICLSLLLLIVDLFLIGAILINPALNILVLYLNTGKHNFFRVHA